MTLSGAAGPAEHGGAAVAPRERPAEQLSAAQEWFAEIGAVAAARSDGALLDKVLRHAAHQTRRLNEALEAVSEARDSFWAAQAVVAVLRGATGPLGATGEHRSDFYRAYSTFRRMLGREPAGVPGLSESRDWAHIEDEAERLVASALGVVTGAALAEASSADPAGAGWGLWVEVEWLYLARAGSGGVDETAMEAWVRLCALRDDEFQEVAGGVVRIGAAGSLEWSEPLRWAGSGLEWMQQQGIDGADVSVLDEPAVVGCAEAGLEL